MRKTTSPVLSIQKTIDAFPDGTIFDIDDCLTICPYTVTEITMKDRSAYLREWRQIYSVWHAINSNNLTKTSNEVEQDHSTIIHSLVVVRQAIEIPKSNKSMHAKIMEILAIKPMVNEYKKSLCICTNEIISMVQLENLIQSRL